MATPSKRMFEHADEGKFWEVWADGPNVYTRHGKLGANGQTKVKSGGDAELAKMIKEKIGAGYVQTGGAVDKGPQLDKKELKRHLANIKSFDDDAVLVLADWLQTQNHPWGELIVLQHGAATNPKKAASLTKQADKHLKENGPAILGDAFASHSSFEWRSGLLRRAVVGCHADGAAIVKAVKAIASAPAAHLLEQLVVAPYVHEFKPWRDWGQSTSKIVDPWTDLDKIAAAIPDRISKVGLGGWPAPAAAGYVTMPTFTKVSSAFSDVTGLELTGWPAVKIGKLSLPKVTELAIRFARSTSAALEAVAAAKVPKLERLTLWIGGSSNVCVDDVYYPEEYDEDNDITGLARYPETFSADDLEGMSPYNSGIDLDITADDLRGALSATYSPSLTHLEIGAPNWTPEVMTAIVSSPLVKRIKSLTISGGRLDEDDIKPLTKKALGHLESLQITSQASDKVAKKLKVLFPDVAPASEDGARDDFHFRYVATVE